MELYTFDYKTEQIFGNPLPPHFLLDLLTENNRIRIVHDTKGFLGNNQNFGINYGFDGKKGFVHDDLEYVLNVGRKLILLSQKHLTTANLFYDADKRGSFATYKIKLESIDEVLDLFSKQGYQISP